MSETELKEQSNITSPQSTLKEFRILVVDDDANTRDMLADLLKIRGANVKVAESAAEARLVFGAWRPQVVISDLGMPDEDGYDFIRSIRAFPGGSATKAIALTGFIRKEDRQRALAAGYDHFAVKPVGYGETTSYGDLIALVQSLPHLTLIT